VRRVFAVLVLLLAGCGAGGAAPPQPAPAVPVGTSSHTIGDRSYRLYRPAGLPGTPVPLVVMLHGGFGSASQAQASYGWDAQADAAHFVVAYPDGVNRAWSVGGGCCGTPGSAGVDDVAFITAVVAAVSRAMPIDPARVYATGISNGGMMAYRLACDSTLFAAIGPDSATLLGSCPAPAPISVIHIHGTADTRIRYGGGQGDGFAKIDGPAVPAVVEQWRGVNRCGPPVVGTAGSVTTSTATCPDGRAVELITIDGAGHQWPGGKGKPVAERVLGTDPPSTALDATSVIWRFFADHPAPR
jgi:polyhydroxybutyrate depolymerase